MNIEDVKRDVFRTLKWLANDKEVSDFIFNDADPFGHAEHFKWYKDTNEKDVNFSTEEFKIAPGELLEMAILSVPASWRKFAEISRIPYMRIVELIAGRTAFTQPDLDALEKAFPNVPVHVWIYVASQWTQEDAHREAMRRFECFAKQELNNER